MKCTLTCSRSRDRHVKLNGTIFTIESIDGGLEIVINNGDSVLVKRKQHATDHHVYELEKLAECLRIIALKAFQKVVNVPSREIFIGTTIEMRLSIRCFLSGIKIICSPWQERRLRTLVDIDIISEGAVLSDCYEIEDILSFSWQVYNLAREIAVSIWGEQGWVDSLADIEAEDAKERLAAAAHEASILKAKN